MIFSLANFVSIFRVPLAPLSCYYFVQSPMGLKEKILFSLMILTVIALDALDGIIARKMKQESPLGAKLDIYCDRLVELLYIAFFAFILKNLPIWVFVYFLIRGLVVDSLSFKDLKPLGNSFLRGSRFMRAVSGTLKVLMFVGLAWAPLYLSSFLHNTFLNFDLVLLITYTMVLVSFLRAIPTIKDFLRTK